MDDTARAVVLEWLRDVDLPIYSTRDMHLDGLSDRIQAAVQDATGYSPLLSCCRSAKRHVEHQLDALASERDAADRRTQALAAALDEIMALLDEGRLVRDTSADADTPTYLRQSVRLVKALSEAKAALDAARGEGA